jgi:signal transduction histidine kinase
MQFAPVNQKRNWIKFFFSLLPPGISQKRGSITLSQRFMLASLVILVAGMLGIGWWVSQQIEAGVIHRTSATTALFVDSFVSLHLQELGQAGLLSPDHQQMLSDLMRDTPLGKQIVAFKVWVPPGKVLFSTDPTQVGSTFPLREGLIMAFMGQVSSEISSLDEEENIALRSIRPQLLETYSPVRLNGTGRVIAVAEFYQTIDDLQKDIIGAQQRSWLVVGAAMLIMYMLLAGFVRGASHTIQKQQVKLSDQVTQLTGLLGQNAELNERVRRAAARSAALNERFLRRISAELHDGPAQDISLGLLRLDHIIEHSLACPVSGLAGCQNNAELETVQASMQRALAEVRAISSGLGVPQLEHLSLEETMRRVVRVHQRRTDSQVSIQVGNLPGPVTMPVKVTVYRVLQEALNNAYRHGGGLNQSVSISERHGVIDLLVSDDGPGFDCMMVADWESHLGLVGMRERVESLGGQFRVESQPGRGTKVYASLPMQLEGGIDE